MFNMSKNYDWLEEELQYENILPFDKRKDSLSNTLDRTYDEDFIVDAQYRSSMSDLQEGPSSNIKGSKTFIHKVGIHNFRLPLKLRLKPGYNGVNNNKHIELETSITGTVSLEGNKKGINMSRIMRSFYDYKDEVFSIWVLEDILKQYQNKLGSYDANIILNFSFPIIQESLRSGLKGYQYYNTSFEATLNKEGIFKKFIHFDFIYSSACPCSFELAMQAMQERNKAVVSHSQRSKARITIEFDDMVWIEDIRDICAEALQTETQVMVKREDECAFAEKNGSNLKFVEDAVRLLHEQLDSHPQITDFKIICSHLESLHSHDAISVLVKGVEGGLTPDVPVEVYKSLVC